MLSITECSDVGRAAGNCTDWFAGWDRDDCCRRHLAGEVSFNCMTYKTNVAVLASERPTRARFYPCMVSVFTARRLQHAKSIHHCDGFCEHGRHRNGQGDSELDGVRG